MLESESHLLLDSQSSTVPFDKILAFDLQRRTEVTESNEYDLLVAVSLENSFEQYVLKYTLTETNGAIDTEQTF